MSDMHAEMSGRRRVMIPAGLLIILCALAAALLFLRFYSRKPISLKGAVIRQDSDARKELPIADVAITALTRFGTLSVTSDASGFFAIPLPRLVLRGQAITLSFRDHGYRELVLHEFVGDKLYIARMAPLAGDATPAPPGQPGRKVANVRVRYSVKAMTELNVGSAVKTFQIENTGNVPCKGQHPCSPDGKWKAALGSATLDAGPGNEFRNARASCIAGPCPFTKIEADAFSQGGRTITASARDWSDTATFLLEAEVFRSMISPIIHESYVSMEADIDGQTIIFPLGPALLLSWANCNARVNPDETRVYRCELKPGYKFQ
jgi:hypothetical protein